jgi:NTP pyrophosphatase (non-canonical NTP hydrolase)
VKELTFRQLQNEQKSWVKHNFPNRGSYQPLLGAIEELSELAHVDSDSKHIIELIKSLGRLSHSHLKKEQKIRIGKNHDEDKADAVADLIIFLSDYCEANGLDLQNIVEETWKKVKTRNWKKYPKNGKTE